MASRLRLIQLGLAATCALLIACGGKDADAGERPLEDETLVVGSKAFTEQLILGQLLIIALEDAGASVVDRTGIQDTREIRAALVEGEIDLYWEYTGTGWGYLEQEAAAAPPGSEALYDQLALKDLENGVVWLERSPLNNTFAIATARDRAAELGVRTLSDYAALVNRDPSLARLCGAERWLSSEEGLLGLEAAYGFDLPPDAGVPTVLGDVHAEVAAGERCDFGEVFATDVAILENDLIVLEDDLDFFYPYNVAVNVRQEVFDRLGDELEEILNPIAVALDNETMLRLIGRVEIDGLEPAAVAEAFLRETELID